MTLTWAIARAAIPVGGAADLRSVVALRRVRHMACGRGLWGFVGPSEQLRPTAVRPELCALGFKSVRSAAGWIDSKHTAQGSRRMAAGRSFPSPSQNSVKNRFFERRVRKSFHIGAEAATTSS